MIGSGTRYPTVNSSSRAPGPPSSERAGRQSVCAAGAVAWARSPRTVMDPCYCGGRSCGVPWRRGPEPRRPRCGRRYGARRRSTIRPRPAGPGRPGSTAGRRPLGVAGRASDLASSSLSRPAVARRNADRFPYSRRSTPEAVSVGQVLSRSVLKVALERTSASNTACWVMSLVALAAWVFHASLTSCSRTTWRPSLARLDRRRALFTTAATSDALRVTVPKVVTMPTSVVGG